MSIPIVLANRPSRMNKTEAAYAELLELARSLGEIDYFVFEQVHLRLAHRTFYIPDFMVVRNGKPVEFHEVKGGKMVNGKSRGYWREDARLKIKAVAELHPWARFIGAWCNKGVWSYEEF